MTEILRNLLVPRAPAPSDGAAVVPGAAVSPGAKDGIEQAWLRELERAQLRQQPAETPRGAAAADPKSEGARGEHDAPRPGSRPQAAGSPVASRAARTPAARAAGGATPPPASPAEAPTPGARPPQSPPAGRAADAAPLQRPALAFEAEIACRLWGEPRKWEPRRVHVRERDAKVWVWIRDAEFEEPDAARVTAALAQLAREVGLELEGVTVNGHVVFGPAPGDDPNRSI